MNTLVEVSAVPALPDAVLDAPALPVADASGGLSGGALAALFSSTLLAACGGGGGGGDAAPAAGAPAAFPGSVPPPVVPAPAPIVAPPPPVMGTPSPPPPAPAPAPAPTPNAPPPAPAPVSNRVPAPPAANPADPNQRFKSAANDNEAARFLLQAQLSATEPEIAAARSEPYAAWLQRQIETPPSGTAWDWLESRGYGVADTNNYFDQGYPGDYAIWRQLMTSPDGLRQRVALALSEFFVVSLSGMEIEWRSHVAADWWDMLAANAFGNFRTLLESVTLHAAMGHYLNTNGNQKENAQGRQPDENYAREVMQLFTIGVSQLNADGTPRLGGDGKPLDSYTAADVTNLARVFTGWVFDKTDNITYTVGGRTVRSTQYARKPMRLVPANHSTLAATFLGTTIAAGTDGVVALRSALDALFAHPNVGPFFAKQMIQRLVTGNPSAAYVGRVAAVFNADLRGQRGNLAAVFAAILLDDEARDPAMSAQAGFGKLREPILRLAQWGRSAGLASARGSWKLGDQSRPDNQLGQSPLRSGSVFNFFRPGYVPPGTALATTQATAPEFQLVNETSVGGYLNYLQNVVRNGLYVTAPDVPQNASNGTNGYDLAPGYAREMGLVTDAAALVQRLNVVLCAGQLKAATANDIVTALNATPVTAASSDAAKRDRIAAAVLCVMASADYLIQK